MEMIRHEAPSKQLDISLRNQVRESLEEILFVLFIPKDVPALDTSGHHMLQNIRYIKSCGSRHERILANYAWQVNENLQFLPTSPISFGGSAAAQRTCAGQRERKWNEHYYSFFLLPPFTPGMEILILSVGSKGLSFFPARSTRKSSSQEVLLYFATRFRRTDVLNPGLRYGTRP